MTMPVECDPFESPRLLLAGATLHIALFDAKVSELREQDWVTPKPDPERPGGVILEPHVKAPPELRQILFDITSNLRSALDHAAYASTVALTGVDATQTKFPFGDTPEEVRRDAKRRCRDVPEDILKFMVAFEPHMHGNVLLWGLNKLRNTKSHRVLLPFAANVGMVGSGPPSPGTTASHEWNPATGRFYPSLELAPNVALGGIVFAFRLQILIGTGKFRGEPALDVLNRMLGEVERVVSAIEAETLRMRAARRP